MSNTYAVNDTLVTLRPEYVEFHRRDHDEETRLFNADEVINSIVSTGHPYANRVLEDYLKIQGDLLAYGGRMSSAEAEKDAIVIMLELAYGISHD